MDSNLIDAIIREYVAKTTCELGIYFKDLSSGTELTHGADMSYPSASVFKIYVLAELFRQIGEGRFTLADRYPLNDEDKSSGSGVMRLLDCGLNPTIKDYATLMMIISDNTAADFLFKLTGKENIRNNVINALGLKNTKCDLTCSDLVNTCFQIKPGQSLADRVRSKPNLRKTPAFTGGLEENDETSPRDVGKMLELLYTGKWVNREADDQALSIMKLCQTNSRIPKFLPPGTSVAHKTGSIDRVANDAGIVYTANGDYILALFYNGNTASEEEYLTNSNYLIGEELLASISRDIYNAFVQ